MRDKRAKEEIPRGALKEKGQALQQRLSWSDAPWRRPLLEGPKALERREYLFVGIDNFSRDLYAAILPDRTQNSAKIFLEQVLGKVPIRSNSSAQTTAKGTANPQIVNLDNHAGFQPLINTIHTRQKISTISHIL